MSKFNLDDYETVKSRKQRFYKDYPDGRIIVNSVKADMTEALLTAAIFLNREDHLACLPKATGYAHEFRDTEKKVNAYGKEYESVNYTSWVENCEESAIGRALDNAGYCSNGKCSQEEIKKVVAHIDPKSPTTKSSDPGEHMIRFGKYNNRKINELTDKEISEYSQFLISSSKNKGKTPEGDARDFVTHGAAWLATKMKKEKL